MFVGQRGTHSSGTKSNGVGNGQGSQTKRQRKPRTLTVEEFQKFVPTILKEPFRTIALVCVCFGLRISECLALRWSDIDWLNSSLHIERGIVRQNVDDVKTDESEQRMTIDADMLELLKGWKKTSQFTAPADWIFASPTALGKNPWSYPWVWKGFQNAQKMLASASWARMQCGTVTAHGSIL